MIKVSWIEDISPPFGLDERDEEPTFKKKTGILLNCQKTMTGTLLSFVLDKNGNIYTKDTQYTKFKIEDSS